MIRCALAERRRLLTLTPARLRPSISPSRTRGSTTTPLPITEVFSACRIPEGIRWNLNSSPSRTMVWPALLPPWKRTIVVARSARRSTTFPLPSSPHWAPTMTTPGMPRGILTVAPGGRSPVLGDPGHRWLAAILAAQLDLFADFRQPRNGSASDLLFELHMPEVGGYQHGPLTLVALIDQRVELLEHPVRPFL